MDPDYKPQALDDRDTWDVGGNRIELRRADTGGWTARIHRENWDGDTLDVDGVFDTREEAAAWCERMADVFTRDMADDFLDDGEA